MQQQDPQRGQLRKWSVNFLKIVIELSIKRCFNCAIVVFRRIWIFFFSALEIRDKGTGLTFIIFLTESILIFSFILIDFFFREPLTVNILFFSQ